MPTIPSAEAGHHPNRWYAGQDGHIHLNGANIVFDGTPADGGPFLMESAADGIVAFAGGGQAGAVALVAQQNRVITVATAGDSVKLPTSAAGLEVTVINSGANPMQVFGAGTDTINGVATATGVSQPANSVVEYSCITAGSWFAEGLGVGFAGSLFTESTQDNVVAFAGGGQAGATLITAQTVRVNTVATAGDSIKLPAAAAGLELVVINHGANAMQVYGLGTDQIDDVAAATGVSQIAGSVCIYSCCTNGKWYSNGIGTGYAGSFPTVSSANGLTARAGGGQGSATAVTTCIARFTTVATAGDSAVLPVSAAGMQITVSNAAAANLMNLFPATGEQINALGANAAFAIAAGKSAVLSCAVAGQWHAVLSA